MPPPPPLHREVRSQEKISVSGAGRDSGHLMLHRLEATVSLLTTSPNFFHYMQRRPPMHFQTLYTGKVLTLRIYNDIMTHLTSMSHIELMMYKYANKLIKNKPGDKAKMLK